MRNWLVLAFALVVAIALGFSASTLLNSRKPDVYPHYVEVTTGARGKASIKRVVVKTPCQQPENRDESYLCTQWRSAQAAERAADFADTQTWANWLGVIGLLATLMISSRAARHAAEAAEAAKDANRPWLELEITGYEPLKFEGPRAHFAVTVKIHNRGNSPATNVLVIAQLVPIAVTNVFDSGAAVRKVSEVIKKMSAQNVGKVVFPSTPLAQNAGAVAEGADIDAAEEAAPGNVVYQIGLGVRYRFGKSVGETVYSFNILNTALNQMALPRNVTLHAHQLELHDNFAGYAA